MMIALLLASAPAIRLADVDQRIADALSGLAAEIEDDVGRADAPLVAIETKTCESRFVTRNGAIAVKWNTARQVGFSDGFIFVSAPPAQFAIVADVEKSVQREKLKSLSDALVDLAAQCANPDARISQSYPEQEGTNTP